MRDNIFMKLAIEQLCRNVVVGAAAAASSNSQSQPKQVFQWALFMKRNLKFILVCT